MKTTYYFILNSDGTIVDYSLPFDIKGNEQIEEILPLYSSIGSYQYLIDLVIEAYEFTYNNIEYIVDTVLKRDKSGFRIIMDDRTLVYKQKSINQTKQNALLIEQEYKLLRNQYLATKNKYMDFVLAAIHEMVLDSNSRIEQSLESLSYVNTYIKDDQSKINKIVDEIKAEIKHIENSISHSNIFNHIDPTTLLNKPELINLKKLINEISVDLNLNTSNIELNFPEHTTIYGNKKFYRNLFNYYFDKAIKVDKKLSITAKQDDEHLLSIQISYYLEVKQFKRPQEFIQIFRFPINQKVETNKEIIRTVFSSLKNAILKQAYYINQVAA